MAVSYDKLFRRIALRANQLQAASPEELQGAYVTPVIGQAEMGDRGVEFPKEAIDDAMLDAMSKMLAVIASNRFSAYRRFWVNDRNTNDINGKLEQGALLPKLSTSGKNIVGPMFDFYDTATGTRLEEKPYDTVLDVIRGDLGLKSTLEVFWYYTDGTKIWHTVNNAKADIFVWEVEVERAYMEQIPRGNCTLPDELTDTLVVGALAHLFRDNFNIDQVQIWQQVFLASLTQLGGGASQ